MQLYDLELDEVVDYLGDGPAWIGDVANDTVAWCDRDPCNELMVTTGTDGEVSATLGSGETFLPGHVWVEPAGRLVAAAVAVEVGLGTDFRLRIYDLRSGNATGEVVADAQLHLGTPWGAWTPAGGQFFLWLPATAGGPRTLFRWPDKGSIEQVDLRGVLDGRSFVVMPKAWVGDPTIWPDTRVPDARHSSE